MTLQRLLAPLRRAIQDYNMIPQGSKIAVGVSGGKDSIALLALLNAFKRFSDNPFELMGITIDMGFKDVDYSPIQQYCDKNNINYVVKKTDIAEILFDVRKESNPCSLCSKMRRGALNATMNEYGFDTLALGHHSDDVIQTFLLSLFFEGRLSTFAPKSFMTKTQVSLIRPMIYIEERNITALVKSLELPVVFNPCPANKLTQRETMKELTDSLRTKYPDINKRFASAIMHPERYNLWDKVETLYNTQKNAPVDKE